MTALANRIYQVAIQGFALHSLAGTESSLHHNHLSNLAKLLVANTGDHHQFFRTEKSTVLFAIRNDAFCDDLAYAWKLFQILGRSGIDIDMQRRGRAASLGAVSIF